MSRKPCFLIIGLSALLGCNPQNSTTLNPPLPQSNPQPKPPALPYSFKEFTLGMHMSDFNKIKPRITYSTNGKFEASRFIDTTIGGQKAKAYLLFQDYGKGLQLYWIDLTLDKLDFYAAKEALISKFGNPDNLASITKLNAMGATFQGERLEWNNGTSKIVAESIGKKIDEASVGFWHLGLGESLGDKLNKPKAQKDN